MSFQAKLILGSTEYNILTVEYAISQQVDVHNRPNGRPRGGIIDLTIESGSNHDLIQWVVQDNMVKNGKIEFYRRDANSSQKTVEFKDGFCIYLKEIFVADGANPMVTKLTISSRELTILNVNIQNAWAGMQSGSGSSGSGSSSETTSTGNTVQFD